MRRYDLFLIALAVAVISVAVTTTAAEAKPWNDFVMLDLLWWVRR